MLFLLPMPWLSLRRARCEQGRGQDASSSRRSQRRGNRQALRRPNPKPDDAQKFMGKIRDKDRRAMKD